MGTRSTVNQCSCTPSLTVSGINSGSTSLLPCWKHFQWSVYRLSAIVQESHPPLKAAVSDRQIDCSNVFFLSLPPFTPSEVLSDVYLAGMYLLCQMLLQRQVCGSSWSFVRGQLVEGRNCVSLDCHCSASARRVISWDKHICPVWLLSVSHSSNLMFSSPHFYTSFLFLSPHENFSVF